MKEQVVSLTIFYSFPAEHSHLNFLVQIMPNCVYCICLLVKRYSNKHSVDCCTQKSYWIVNNSLFPFPLHICLMSLPVMFFVSCFTGNSN